MMIQRTQLHLGNPSVSTDEIYQIRYGMAIWLLQENAGLTYKEARVFMASVRNERAEQLAEALGIKKQTVYDLRRSALQKLRGKKLDDILMGYSPIVMETADPSREPFF